MHYIPTELAAGWLPSERMPKAQNFQIDNEVLDHFPQTGALCQEAC